MDIFATATLLFLIMDPLGNLPIFLSVLKNVEQSRRRYIIIRELVIALLILFVFLFTGQKILQFLQIQQETVSIAGGVILLIIALRMIFPKPGGVMNFEEGEEPLIVPLAVPMIAGPSTMAALILLSSQGPDKMEQWSIALLIAWGASASILLTAGIVQKLLGDKGIRAVERLMGMILIMLAIQMLLNGITEFVAHLGTLEKTL